MKYIIEGIAEMFGAIRDLIFPRPKRQHKLTLNIGTGSEESRNCVTTNFVATLDLHGERTVEFFRRERNKIALSIHAATMFGTEDNVAELREQLQVADRRFRNECRRSGINPMI
jgi:hypothetical protein